MARLELESVTPNLNVWYPSSEVRYSFFAWEEHDVTSGTLLSGCVTPNLNVWYPSSGVRYT